MKEDTLVLVVDDQPDNLYMYTGCVRGRRSRCLITAANRTEALLKANRLAARRVVPRMGRPLAGRTPSIHSER
jgi:CheY-like chemotaxis protein